MAPGLRQHHLLGISELTREEVELIFHRAEAYLPYCRSAQHRLPDLRGKTVVLAFFEPSTRTRVSFELAARRLSADVVSFQAAASSLAKGESLLDTVQTLEAMGIDALVVRHRASGVPWLLRRFLSCSIINAGDGQHEHPTQALLDGFTLWKHFGTLRGLRVCIVGDVLHSRVARSNIALLRLFGAEVAVCGPATLLPHNVERVWGIRLFRDLREAVEWADVLNVLRLQRERMESGLVASLEEYHRFFGITEQVVGWNPAVRILHPGPVNYGVELVPEVALGANSYIRQQVTHGVAIRMAVLSLLLGGG
ncbi:MAG: aspartate carbamoyltransferase catalytic subunit [Candidatus Kapabacteria bacterium]|nr:aspartate carbamoyltransferase catalytic subunit [Candidatus Kapabacteria bacterium]MDW8011663.1 aspartate carbamoyltransferase catalytic subunit [Bacteroidota bacterium]